MSGWRAAPTVPGRFCPVRRKRRTSARRLQSPTSKQEDQEDVSGKIQAGPKNRRCNRRRPGNRTGLRGSAGRGGSQGRDSEVADQLVSRYGGIDILVNNAGIARSETPAEKVTDEHWLNVVDVNL